MPRNVIVLISGFPGTGKTTLGNTLSERFKFPYIAKDAFKERMFDALGWSDKAWSLKVSAASHRIMDYVIEEELKAGHSIIVESNFKNELDGPRFRTFQSRFGCAIVQILCWAEGEVVFTRFMERQDSDARHPGHIESASVDDIRKGFIEAGGKDTPLDINGTTIELETTDFNAIRYDSIYEAIESSFLLI
jgi:predicted kinase